MLARLAQAPFSALLIGGETGTGKGLAARIPHYAGPRGGGPLVEINCAALPRDLATEVSDGRFRADLYHRLSVFRLDLPSLRGRKGDLRQLVPHFVAEYNAKAGKRVKEISDQAWRRLEGHDWPGNVRELRNVVERCVLFADDDQFPVRWLQLQAGVPAAPSGDGLWLPLDGSLSLDDMERAIVETALERADGNVTGAARLLRSTWETLRYRVEKFALGKAPAEPR